MTTAATISVNLKLGSGEFQRGMKQAEKATDALKGKLGQLQYFIERNQLAIAKFADGFRDIGKKMTLFMTIPILGFFTMLIKKAMDADTELGKMARDSVGKLNEQLLILGEKLLPSVIKIIDWLTNALKKFNEAPQWIQDTIFALVILAAMAGPLSTLIGVLLDIALFFSSTGGGAAIVKFIASTMIPSIVSMGTAIWGALIPLLPVIALILALILLVYLVWSNWDELGVIFQQLGAILKYEFTRELDLLKKSAEEAASIFRDEWTKSLDVWKANFQQALQIIQKAQKIATDAMTKMVMDFVAKAVTKFNEFRNNITNTVNYIANVFFSIFSAIGSFVNAVIVSIIEGINYLIDAINSLGFALDNLEVPAELTPGSPTPFEIGLKGISKTMDVLSKKSIPAFNAAFAAPSGISEVGGGSVIHFTDNRRFGAGVTADVIRLAMDHQFDELTRLIQGD